MAGPTAVTPAGIAQQQLPRKQPELDHARNYVKKIKVRFLFLFSFCLLCEILVPIS